MLALLILLAGAPGWAAVVTQAPTGDGAGDAVRVENQTVHPVVAEVGPPGALDLELPVPAHGVASLRVQCVAWGDLPLPSLALRVEGRTVEVPARAVNLADGAPSLWIAPRGATGRAALEAVVASVARGARVVALEDTAVPEGFDGLRLAERILISASDLARLAPAARQAVRGAVAAGAVLVVGAGQGEVEPEALVGFAAVTLGAIEAAGPALLEALPQAPSRRALAVGAGAAPRLLADGAPVVVEATLGLGRVRVLAVQLEEVAAGPVAAAAFGPGPDGVRQVLAWLSRAPLAAESAGLALAWWIWALLLTLPILGLAARRWPRLAAGLGVGVWAAALAAPPLNLDLGVEAQRTLYLPLDAETALAVGTTDVRVGAGGVRTLALTRGADRWLAVEDVAPSGGCLLSAPEASLWVVRAQPGDRRRLAWFALVPRPAAGAPGEPFAAWPAGPLAGAPRFEVSETAPVAVDAPLEGAAVEAWLAVPAPSAPPSPKVLPPPPG